MNISPQIEPRSSKHLLICLGLAIDEAKLVRSIVMSRQRADQLISEEAVYDRLGYLNREIEYLEMKLQEVRKQADKKLRGSLQASE